MLEDRPHFNSPRHALEWIKRFGVEVDEVHKVARPYQADYTNIMLCTALTTMQRAGWTWKTKAAKAHGFNTTDAWAPTFMPAYATMTTYIDPDIQ